MDFSAFGLISNQKLYKVCYEINRFFGLKLKRESENIDVYHPKEKKVSLHKHYKFEKSDGLIIWALFSNKEDLQKNDKTSQLTLFAEDYAFCIDENLKDFDYFFLFRNEINPNETCKLQQIENLTSINRIKNLEQYLIKNENSIIHELI